MRGGYQIVDLSNVTIGTETKVDGVYKTISGFDGKPVFIITPNTSGVFAEFTENSGMYIGAYIGSNSHLFTVSIISSDQVTITDKGPAGGGGTSNYNELSNKPAIAGTTLTGDKSLSDLGIQGQLTEGTNITIDEHNNISANINSMAASNVTVDNTSTGLTADDVQDAIVELQTNKTAKSDITSIICTGTTNATGSTIENGSEFYLNSVLCKATADIADGATFTLNTNYETTTVAGELTELNSNLSHLLFNTATNLIPNNTITIPNATNYDMLRFTFTSDDGLISVDANPNTTVAVRGLYASGGKACLTTIILSASGNTYTVNTAKYYDANGTGYDNAGSILRLIRVTGYNAVN